MFQGSAVMLLKPATLHPRRLKSAVSSRAPTKRAQSFSGLLSGVSARAIAPFLLEIARANEVDDIHYLASQALGHPPHQGLSMPPAGLDCDIGAFR